MDINSSCLYGALYSSDVTVFTSRPDSPTSTGGLNIITWALNDFANTPKSIGVSQQTALYFRINFPTSQWVNTFYAYFSTPANFWEPLTTRPHILYWDNFQYSPVSSSTRQFTFINENPLATLSGNASGGTVLQLNQEINTKSVIIVVHTQTAGQTFGCGEVGAGLSAIIPTLPDQQSFTLTPAQPQKQTFTCQNGREIVYYSATQTRNINATFQWSDDGETARGITRVHKLRLESGSPLLFAMGADPNEPTKRVIELVNSDIQPVNRQAGKVYSHTITGGTQP